jgi:hypothetical protein
MIRVYAGGKSDYIVIDEIFCILISPEFDYTIGSLGSGCILCRASILRAETNFGRKKINALRLPAFRVHLALRCCKVSALLPSASRC